MKHNLVKQLMSIVISISILSQGLFANVSTTPEQDREEFIEYLQAQQEVYKAEFDKEMILESLGYDVDKIIDFVSNKIVYQAYDGVLRGVEGTLIGRAGNSHDQAITLASMLNGADVEAQIMVGELNDVQIEELNKNIGLAQLPLLSPVNQNNLPLSIQKMFSETQSLTSEAEKKSIEIYKENMSISKNIYSHIPQKALEKSQTDFKEILNNTTKSYRWVRYRTSSNSPWIEVHPTYTKAKEWKLHSVSIEAGSVNDKEIQKLGIQVWIETSDGKKHSVTGKWEAPSANLMGKPLSIEINSDAVLHAEVNSSIEEQAKQSNFFFVKINNELPREGKVFDLKGMLHDYSILSAINNKMNAVNTLFNDALSFTKNKNKTPTQITKVWITFTIKQTGTKNKVIERILFQGKSLNNAKNTTLILLQRWDINIATTTPMQNYHQSIKINQISKQLSALQQIKEFSKKNKTASSRTIFDTAFLLFPNPSLAKLENIRSLFDISLIKDPDVSYLHEINILALRKGFIPMGDTVKLYSITDIVSNSRWTLTKNNHPSIMQNIQHGVWETYAETHKIRKETHIQSLNSAFKSLNKTQVYKENTSTSKRLKLYHDEKTWWDVNLITGNTKGMLQLDQGIAGAEIVEYKEITIFAVTLMVSSYFFKAGTEDCLSKGGNPTCCIGLNGSLWLVGLMGGWVAGSVMKAGIATTRTLGIASVTFDVGSSQLPVTKFCTGK